MSVAVEEPAQATHALHDSADALAAADIETPLAEAVEVIRKQALATESVVPLVENGTPDTTADDHGDEHVADLTEDALPAKLNGVAERVHNAEVEEATEVRTSARTKETVQLIAVFHPHRRSLLITRSSRERKPLRLLLMLLPLTVRFFLCGFVVLTTLSRRHALSH